MDQVVWFLIVFLHASQCPGKCEPAPAVTIVMPSREVCKQIKEANPDAPLECWGKPK
jgi:hypothetical protein